MHMQDWCYWQDCPACIHGNGNPIATLTLFVTDVIVLVDAARLVLPVVPSLHLLPLAVLHSSATAVIADIK